MHNGLIGYTGFVGGTLLRQSSFDSLYRSTNIAEIKGKSFDTLICAGAPAQKWIANREPEEDKKKIEALIALLDTVKVERLILISTVDVFNSSIGVDEKSEVIEEGLHPYGLHRRHLEKFVQRKFPNSLTVRLPGLVGPGLKKNVIFDFLNQNNLSAIESRGVFQFYPMVNLWYDLQIALRNQLNLLHLTSAPISVAEISSQGFGQKFEQVLDKPPATYDMKTLYAPLFGGSGHYQYSVREVVQAVRAYAQSEPRTLLNQGVAK